MMWVPQSLRRDKSLLSDAFAAQLETGELMTSSFSFSLCCGALAEGAEFPNPPQAPLFESARVGPNNVNEENRTVSGIANEFGISRSGIRVHIDGMQLEHFNNLNPVVLAAHRQVSADLMPGAIGTIEKVSRAKEGKQLRFRNMRFDKDPIAEAWFQKVLSGTVRMTSVGFLPLQWSVETEKVGRGKDAREEFFIDIPESELLEISVVPIGANRGALIGQVSQQSLLQRVRNAEEQTAKLQRALDGWIASQKTTSAESVRRRLLTALDQVA